MCAWPTFQKGVTCLPSLFMHALLDPAHPYFLHPKYFTHFKVMLLPFLEQISHPLETIKEPKRGVQLKSDKFCKWKISISQAEQKQLCMQGIVYPEPWIPPNTWKIMCCMGWFAGIGCPTTWHLAGHIAAAAS